MSSQKGKCAAAKSPKEGTPHISQSFLTSRPRGTGQTFNFVNNASEPLRTKDAAVRKLVRSHAMKEVVRERRERKKAELKNANTGGDKARGANETSCPSGYPRARLAGDDVVSIRPAREQTAPCTLIRPEIDYCFTDHLSKIQANIRRLRSLYFSQVGSPVFPIEFHLAYDPPTQLFSLDSSFTNDEVVIQSLGYAAAVCSTMAEGKRHSSFIVTQMGLTISLINRLLNGGMWMADGMLGAVCHLAMGEALRGNLNDWAVHMTGLKQMVKMRGGMDKIHFYLRMKLHRADLLGSIDQVCRPFFHYDRSRLPAIRTKPSLPTCDISINPNNVRTRIRALLPQLETVIMEIREFSEIVEQTLLTPEAQMDPKACVEAWFSIHYYLLSNEPLKDVSAGRSIHEKDELDKAFRLGAMIYIKEILPKLTFSATGSRILVSKLKTPLGNVLTSQVTPTSSSLLLWLLVMGGVASIKNSRNHTFFVAHLVRLRGQVGLDGWEDVKERLENVLWVGTVLDKAGRDLWEEVQLASRILCC